MALDGLLRGDADLGGVQGVALSHQDLGTDDVDVGDQLGDGVLDLDTGVHLDEVGVALQVHQEFAGTGIAVANVAAQCQSAVEDLLTGCLGNGECGRILDDLLVTALDGAVTVIQVDHVAVVIGQHLNFHVLGAAQILFDEDLVIAEGLLGLVDGFLEFLLHVLSLVDDTHAAAAAAVGCLQHNGVADLLGHFHGLFHGLHGVVNAGDDGHVGGDGDLLGRDLVAHGVHAVHGGADEDDAVLLALFHQDGVFCQEAVAGVDGVDVVVLGDLDDGGDIQISVNGAAFGVQGVGFVSQITESGVLVFFGVNGNGGNVQLVQSTEYTDGDLAAVGDQNALKLSDAYFAHGAVSFSLYLMWDCIPSGWSRRAVHDSNTNVLFFNAIIHDRKMDGKRGND